MTHPSTHRAQCHLPIVHNLPILTSIHPFTVHSSICIYPSVHMICSPSLLPSVHRSVHSSTHPSLALSIHLPICSLFPIRPPICPLSITPVHAELLGHLSQPNSPRLSNNLLSIPPVLIFRIIPLSIYAVCLPGHPLSAHPSSACPSLGSDICALSSTHHSPASYSCICSPVHLCFC